MVLLRCVAMQQAEMQHTATHGDAVFRVVIHACVQNKGVPQFRSIGVSSYTVVSVR